MISFYKSLYYLGIVCAICANSPALADFYKYKDASDHIYLTDYPMGKSYKLISRIRTAPVRHRQLKNRKRQFSKLIAKIAKRYKLESALLHAMIRVESAYNPKAKSKVGAVGLMQLMPTTAKLYGVSNRLNPEENIAGGARLLCDLLKRYNNDLSLVLAAYNAGVGAVLRHGNKIPPYSETRNYVKKVLKLYNRTRGIS